MGHTARLSWHAWGPRTVMAWFNGLPCSGLVPEHQQPVWQDCPPELLSCVCRQLSFLDKLQAESVCKAWRSVLAAPSVSIQLVVISANTPIGLTAAFQVHCLIQLCTSALLSAASNSTLFMKVKGTCCSQDVLLLCLTLHAAEISL